MTLAATAAAGQALNAANAAAAAAAAPELGPAYDFQAYRIASASLPAQPAAVSSAGRRPSQPPAAFRGQFQPQGPQGGQGIRKRGRPPRVEPKQQQQRQSGQGIASFLPLLLAAVRLLSHTLCVISAGFLLYFQLIEQNFGFFFNG